MYIVQSVTVSAECIFSSFSYFSFSLLLAPHVLSPFLCLICNYCVIRAARQKGGATIISVWD